MSKQGNKEFRLDSINRSKDEYLLDEPLWQAVQLALRLDQPLLLTGYPGTGKTRLAAHVARLLKKQTAPNPQKEDQGGEEQTGRDQRDENTKRFSDQVWQFDTKTTSRATDLFYEYDAVGHFQYINVLKNGNGSGVKAAAADQVQTEADENANTVTADPEKTTADFIRLTALGKAWAMTHPAGQEERNLLPKDDKIQPQPQSSVVLIDEIDKAPRDFTNDLLNEIDNKKFDISELDQTIEFNEASGQRVLIIMTSNSEKTLPDPFLRRCVFYHIPLPDKDRMKAILNLHLQADKKGMVGLESKLDNLVDEFLKINNDATKKASTAELVAFVKMIGGEHLPDDKVDLQQLLLDNLSILIKTTEDWEQVKGYLKKEIEKAKTTQS